MERAACQVCNSSNNVRCNFGVYSCVSCRIFFSRNIEKELICLQNNSCRIEGESRKSCAHCRFQKCLKCGMKKTRNKISRGWKTRKLPSPKKRADDPTSTQRTQDFVQDYIRSQSQCSDFLHHQERLSEASHLFMQPFKAESIDAFENVGDPGRGLAIAEAILRKNLSHIKLLPVVDSLDKPLLAKMIKEKIFGLLIIYSAILYKPKQDSFIVSFLDENQKPGQPSSVSHRQYSVKDFISSIFSSLKKVAVEMGYDNLSEMLLPVEGGEIFSTSERFLKTMHEIFGQDIAQAVPAFMGLYLFVPNYRQVSIPDEYLKSRQAFFYTYLNQLIMSRCSDHTQFISTQSRVMLLTAEVRHLELCHLFLGKLIPKDRLSPLMAEIFDH